MEESKNNREKLIARISDLFLRYGLRSTSMDDLAMQLKMSKKTLYQYFANKEDLVEQVVLYRRQVRDRSTAPRQLFRQNPVEIMFAIKAFLVNDINKKYTSNHYDLRKYYPEIYKRLYDEDEAFLQRFMHSLMEEGVNKGFFREDVDMEMQIFLFAQQLNYFKSPDVSDEMFKFPIPVIASAIIDNLLEVVVTEKGKKEMEKLRANENKWHEICKPKKPL